MQMSEHHNRPILITGCARSGTSLTAGILNTCGAFGGELTGPTRWNKRGQFENIYIRQEVTKPYLAHLGVDPLGQWPLPDVPMIIRQLVADAPGIRERMLNALRAQGYGTEDPRRWFYKGAKMCLIWPLYHVAFPAADWVIVRREEEEIVASCLKTGFMRAFDTAEGWKKWVAVHQTRFQEMKDAGLNVTEIWPRRIIGGDFSEIKPLVERLGLKWDKSRVVGFISPALWSGGTEK